MVAIDGVGKSENGYGTETIDSELQHGFVRKAEQDEIVIRQLIENRWSGKAVFQVFDPLSKTVSLERDENDPKKELRYRITICRQLQVVRNGRIVTASGEIGNIAQPGDPVQVIERDLDILGRGSPGEDDRAIGNFSDFWVQFHLLIVFCVGRIDPRRA